MPTLKVIHHSQWSKKEVAEIVRKCSSTRNWPDRVKLVRVRVADDRATHHSWTFHRASGHLDCILFVKAPLYALDFETERAVDCLVEVFQNISRTIAKRTSGQILSSLTSCVPLPPMPKQKSAADIAAEKLKQRQKTLAHADKMLKKWTTAHKRANTMVAKWQRKSTALRRALERPNDTA